MVSRYLSKSGHGRLNRREVHHLFTTPDQGASLTETHAYLESLGTPRALSVWLIFSQGDHSDLKSLSPVDWEDPVKGFEQKKADYWATKLLSKCSNLVTSFDKSELAIIAARQAESHNRETAERLSEGEMPELVWASFRRARVLIGRVLGSLYGYKDSSGNLRDGALAGMRLGKLWTTGRNTAVTREFSQPVFKFGASLDCTVRCAPLAVRLVNAHPLWAMAALGADGPCSVLHSALNYVPGNVAMTVPKNAWIDRFIAYEPALNVVLQRAVGVYLRSRLLSKAGIDLRDQRINQRLARLGSESGFFATLDLRMASDTLTDKLCQLLLPEDWYDLLDRIRSPSTTYPDGRTLRNWKFSSMGNGFTFELETLVFWALSAAASRSGWAYAYGDDIIVDTDDVTAVRTVLTYSGFILNESKSFSSGKFRESCGHDYFAGFYVTAPRADDGLDTIQKIVGFHNRLRGCLSYRGTLTSYEARLLRRIRVRVNRTLHSWSYDLRRDCIPLTVPHGPAGTGDGHFHVNLDECCPARAAFGWDAWRYVTVELLYRSRDSDVTIDTISLTTDGADDGEELTLTVESDYADSYHLDRGTDLSLPGQSVLCTSLYLQEIREDLEEGRLGRLVGDFKESFEARVRKDRTIIEWPSVLIL